MLSGWSPGSTDDTSVALESQLLSITTRAEAPRSRCRSQWAPRPAVTEFMTKLHWMHLIAVVWYFAAALVVQTHFRVGTRWRHRWYSRRRPPSRHKALSTWSTLMNQILSMIWILIFITYNTTAALLVTYLFMLWKDESNMTGSSVRDMCRQSFYKAGVCVLLHRWGQFFYYYTIHL